MKIERDLRALGGIARRNELLARDHPRDLIDIMLMYRSFIAVRHGWYAVPDVAADVLTAWRAGGRLACVSAAAHYGLVPRQDGPVHVSVARNSSRLTPIEGTILHWDDERAFQDLGSKQRAAVPEDRARTQMRRCRLAREEWWTGGVPVTRATDNL